MAFQQLEDSIRNILKRLGGLESAPAFTVPPGVIWEYAGTVAPSGWILLPPGATASRTENAALFDLIGVTYGAGNGSTTFGLPPHAGRVAVGIDTTQTDFNTLGKTGGAKTHTLTNTELPNIAINIRRADGDVNDYLGGSGAAYGIATPYSTGGAEYNIASTRGGGGAHNNLQPYIVLNFIIKT
jgi:microcystin-dependent protein